MYLEDEFQCLASISSFRTKFKYRQALAAQELAGAYSNLESTKAKTFMEVNRLASPSSTCLLPSSARWLKLIYCMQKLLSMTVWEE